MSEFIKNLAFDFDGVIVNTAKLFLNTARRLGIGENLYMKDWDKYLIQDVDSFNISNKDAIILRKVMENFRNKDYRLMPGAKSVLTYMFLYTRIPIITARAKSPDETLDNLFKVNHSWEIEFDVIACNSGNEFSDKTEAMRKLNKNILIEDSVENCRDIAANGLIPIVFNTIQNKSEKHNFMSVDGWKGIAKLIEMPMELYKD